MAVGGLLTFALLKAIIMIDFTNHAMLSTILPLLLAEPSDTAYGLGGFCGGLMIANHVRQLPPGKMILILYIDRVREREGRAHRVAKGMGQCFPITGLSRH